MKLLLIGYILTTVAFAQAPAKAGRAANDKPAWEDSTRIGILWLDSGLYRLTSFEGCNAGGYDDDIFKTIDEVLRKAVNEYNREIRKGSRPEQDTICLRKYSRQYVRASCGNERELVWVNCFCTDSGAAIWPKPVVVKDGGKCYFNLVIDLRAGNYSRFKIGSSQ